MTEPLRFEVRLMRGNTLVLQCLGRVDNVLQFKCTADSPIIDPVAGVMLKGFTLIPKVRELPLTPPRV